MKNDPYVFTVTDLGRFLGKSAVTVRGWEKQGLISLPRDSGGDRKVKCSDVRSTARVAKDLGRISSARLRLVEAACTILELLEKETKELK